MVEVRGRAARFRRRARWAGALAAVVPVLAAAACGAVGQSGSSVVGGDSLVIGVQGDQPGLGLDISSDTKSHPDGPPSNYDSYDGFDIRMAKEIARHLKVPARNVTFRRVTSNTREDLILSGEVDLVVGTYSITPKRKTEVTFAGPYYVAHQDILIRRSNPAGIRSLRDLAGKRVCEVQGSQSFPRVRRERSIPALPVRAGGYGDCLDKLIGGQLDAVSTDDLILAGLASKAATTGDYMTLLNAPFSDERYGVGLKKDDVDGCEAVNEAITKMYQDGTMRLELKRWFGPTGLDLVTTVPQFEGCI